QVRLWENPKGYILPLFRLGRSNMMFDTPFDPTLYQDDRVSLMQQQNSFILVSIEANNNIIQTLQQLNLPNSLHEKLQTSWIRSYRHPNFSLNYNQWINQVYAQFDLMELWNQAQDYGFLGDKLNPLKVDIIHIL
ncbi:MAG: hypothetical protein ABRQ26_16560, partial [Syntrophomonadaceae bacterium]